MGASFSAEPAGLPRRRRPRPVQMCIRDSDAHWYLGRHNTSRDGIADAEDDPSQKEGQGQQPLVRRSPDQSYDVRGDQADKADDSADRDTGRHDQRLSLIHI